jgi:hypothetical protein
VPVLELGWILLVPVSPIVTFLFALQFQCWGSNPAKPNWKDSVLTLWFWKPQPQAADLAQCICYWFIFCLLLLLLALLGQRSLNPIACMSTWALGLPSFLWLWYSNITSYLILMWPLVVRSYFSILAYHPIFSLFLPTCSDCRGCGPPLNGPNPMTTGQTLRCLPCGPQKPSLSSHRMGKWTHYTHG